MKTTLGDPKLERNVNINIKQRFWLTPIIITEQSSLEYKSVNCKGLITGWLFLTNGYSPQIAGTGQRTLDNALWFIVYWSTKFSQAISVAQKHFHTVFLLLQTLF